MTNTEIDEIVSKGQTDGATLYKVVDILHRITIVLNWLIAAVGVVLSFFAANSVGFGGFIAGLFFTSIFCAILYAGAVLSSHGAKVLVNISFSNLALLELVRNSSAPKA